VIDHFILERFIIKYPYHELGGKEIKMNAGNSLAFDVCMRTPVGTRTGRMTVFCNTDTVSGRLDILNHSEPFEGTMDRDGNCRLYGKIITLMRAIEYEAIGKIAHDSLELSIIDDRYIFEITGTPCQL
jgi:hypothetical protein